MAIMATMVTRSTMTKWAKRSIMAKYGAQVGLKNY